MIPLEKNIDDARVDGMFPKDANQKKKLIFKLKIMLHFNNYKILYSYPKLQSRLFIFGFFFGYLQTRTHNVKFKVQSFFERTPLTISRAFHSTLLLATLYQSLLIQGRHQSSDEFLWSCRCGRIQPITIRQGEMELWCVQGKA